MWKLLKDTISMAFGMPQFIEPVTVAALIGAVGAVGGSAISTFGGSEPEDPLAEEKANLVHEQTGLIQEQETFPGQQEMLYPTAKAPKATRAAGVIGAGLNVLSGEEVSDEQKYAIVQPATPAAVAARAREEQAKMLNRIALAKKLLIGAMIVPAGAAAMAGYKASKPPTGKGGGLAGL